MRLFFSALILFLVLLTHELSGQTHIVVEAQNLLAHDIWNQSEFLVDSDSTMDLNDSISSSSWQSTAGHASSFSGLYGALWIKTVILNRSLEKLQVLLDHPYTLHNEITVHVWYQDSIIQVMAAGGRVEAIGTVAHNRNPVFQLELHPGETILYTRVHSQGVLSGKFDLWGPMQYLNKVNKEVAFLSLLFGSLLTLVCYNLFVYFSTRSLTQLYFSLFLLAFLTSQFILSGIKQTFIPSGYESWILDGEQGVHLLMKLAWIFSFGLTAYFLKLSTQHPRLRRLIQIVLFGTTCSILGGFFAPYRLESDFMIFLNLSSPLLLLGLGIWSSLQGYRPAHYFSAAWAVVVLASCVETLQAADLLPFHLFTSWAQLLGVTIAGLVLSYALGDSSRQLQLNLAIKREKTIKKMQEQDASHTHSHRQFEKAFYPHQTTLIRNGSKLENTMPTGKADAFVISFNTVNSSKIERSKIQNFLHDVFSLCYHDMLVGYDPVRLQANAYRLKEVGDGFFCSIGFPFQTPDLQNPAELALNLALKFSKNFHAEAPRHGFAKPIQASIAIAFGEVDACYAAGAVVEYNIFGRGIILADRYEKLRKAALRHLTLTGNLLVIDHRVFSMLSPVSQTMFQRFDVDAVQQTIRDDESAHCFYFTELLRAESLRPLADSA